MGILIGFGVLIGFGRRQRKLNYGKRYTSIFLGDHGHDLQSPAEEVDSWGNSQEALLWGILK